MPGMPFRRCTALALVFLAVSWAGCLDGGDRDARPLGPVAGPDTRAFDVPAREFDLVADRDEPGHLALAFITPRADPASPSWLAFAQSEDSGATWDVQRFCGDPLDPLAFVDGIVGCPFWGARLTSDPILLQLQDGAFLYVGVALRAQEVTLFASRYERRALDPTWTGVVSRSAFDVAPGAHMLPAPHMAYYNGKPNVLQAEDGVLHLVWAADLGPENQEGPQVTTGIPVHSTSRDGGRAWATPQRIAPESYLDVGAIYAVGVEAFQTVDGHLHAVWWESHSNALYQVDSGDGGAAWSAPRRIADAVARPADARADSDNVTRPWVGVDRSGGPWHGSVYLLYDDKSTGDRDLWLATSRDHAATWTTRRLDVTHQGEGRDETMARLLVEPSGALSVLYPSWDRVERLAPYDMHFARSTDGGATFQTVRLSSGFSPSHNPGDYNDLDVVPGGLLAVWEDGRDGGRWAYRSTVRV